MASLVTPNLLELVEIHGLPRNLNDLSLSGDKGGDLLIDLSVCGDEVTDGSGLTDFQSVCADEAISDIRLKADIEKVGTTVYGLSLYQFRYKTGAERFEGVMAQDVLEVMPDAVTVGEDGYYRVKYGRLGIRMTRP